MNAVTVSTLQKASANAYANQAYIGQTRKPARVFSSTALHVDKRRGFPAYQSCGYKRQKVLTHAQESSGASTKVLKETAALDQLIDLFLGAKSQEQVWNHAYYIWKMQSDNHGVPSDIILYVYSWPSLLPTIFSAWTRSFG